MFWCLQQLHFSDKLHVFGLDACLRVRLPWHTCAMHSSNLMNITCMSPHYYFFSATKRKLWLFHSFMLVPDTCIKPPFFPHISIIIHYINTRLTDQGAYSKHRESVDMGSKVSVCEIFLGHGRHFVQRTFSPSPDISDSRRTYPARYISAWRTYR